MRLDFLTLFLFFISIVKYCKSRCAFTQTCTDPLNDKCTTPGPPDDDTPFILNGTDIVCKEFLGKEACCNNDQNILLSKNFQALDSVFSTKYDGCDICSLNLKRFWCFFTCAPNQLDFVKLGNITTIEKEGIKKEVRLLTVTVNKDTNCDLFKSCKKTKYASQVTSMSNAIGFTTFQGSEAYRKSQVYMYMNYTDVGGLTFQNDQCNLTWSPNVERYGFNITQNCTCNSCDLTCNYNREKAAIKVGTGFDVVHVIIVYVIIIFFTGLLFAYKKWYKKKYNRDYDERTMSLASEATSPRFRVYQNDNVPENHDRN